jgi:hypothetical protein
MSDNSDPKFRILPGGLYGTKPRLRRRRLKVVGHSAELFRLDARKRLAYLRLVDAHGVVPTEGIQKVREGITNPWRVEGRRYLEMKRSGVAVEDAVAVAMETVFWLMDIYGVSQPHDPNGRVALMRQGKAA